jgi:acyl-CoA:acyl-CoA alkyltransferase
MQFENVCLESIGFSLPEEIVTSQQIEETLSPVYERLGFPPGRLEWMSGVGQRRMWPRGYRISDASVASGERALEVAGCRREDIGLLIHASVCRDFLEPATASRVHHLLKLPPACLVYDVSNACLGLLNGVIQIATSIQAGIIKAGLVVGTESSRNLLEATLQMLLSRSDINRHNIKPSFASLTIGSGSCAILLTHSSISKSQNRLHTAVAQAHTEFHDLCHSDEDQAGANMTPLMETDSEQLLVAGIATGQAAFTRFVEEMGGSIEKIQRTICHQVGSAHRKLMLQTLGLSSAGDYATFPWLGNTGSVALPLTLAMAARSGFVGSGQETALLGIGSGINSVMIGATIHHLAVGGELDSSALDALAAVSLPEPSSTTVVSAPHSASAKPPHILRDGYNPVGERPTTKSPTT